MPMFFRIITMYRVSHSTVGTALISASVSVRQGSPTSCLLSIIYVNDMIALIKQNCGLDGFLRWLHELVLMDDTVFLSTSRSAMMSKIRLLSGFSTSHGMNINLKETKFMVINGDDLDKQPMTMDSLTVELCDQYVYLGSPFTADACLHFNGDYSSRPESNISRTEIYGIHKQK